MAQPHLKLFNTIQEIAAAGKVKLSADERATIERETRDLLSKSKMKNYRFASSVPQGFDMLLEKLHTADAEEAYDLIVEFMDNEEHEDKETPHEEHEEHEDKEEEFVEDVKEDVEKKDEKPDFEKKDDGEEKKDEPEKKEDGEKKEEKKPDFEKKDESEKKPDFMEEKKEIFARVRKLRAQMELEKKGPMKDEDDEMPGKGRGGPGKGDGPKMDGKGPHGPGKGDMKDLKNDKKDKDKPPSMDEMGVEDKDIDPTLSMRAKKVRVKVTAERNIIAYHEDFGPIFLLTPNARTKQSKTAMIRLANRAYGLAVNKGFAVAASKLGAKMLHTAGVDDDVETVTEEKPEAPATDGVLEQEEDVITGEEMDEKDVGDDTQAEADDDIDVEKPKVARYKVLRSKKRAGDLGSKLDGWIGSGSLGDFESEQEIRDYFTQGNAEWMWGPGDYPDEDELDELADYAIEEWKHYKSGKRNAADGDVTDAAEFVTEETPDKGTNDVTDEADDLADETVETPPDSTIETEEVDFKTAKKIEANYKKLYASRLKKAEENFIQKFARCMRIASKRMLLNYDENPWKIASADVLMSDDIEFENGEFFRPMPEHVAVQLTELISTEGHEDFVLHLMDRTADLMEKSAEYLEDAESDISNLKPVAVDVTPAQSAPKREARSNKMRRAASTGNFGMNGKTATARSNNTQDSLRNALSGSDSRVNRDLGFLKG